MTREELEGLVEGSGAENAGGDWKLPEGVALAFHVSRGGAGLTVPKVEAFRVERSLVVASTARGDRFAFDLGDVVAVHLEGPKGETSRRAGF